MDVNRKAERFGYGTLLRQVVQYSHDIVSAHVVDKVTVFVLAEEEAVARYAVAAQPMPGVRLNVIQAQIRARRAYPYVSSAALKAPSNLRSTRERRHGTFEPSLAKRELALAIGALAHSKEFIERNVWLHPDYVREWPA
jgi:hypothetical protein